MSVAYGLFSTPTNSHHRRALAKALLPSGLSTALRTHTSRIFGNLQNGVLNPVNMLR